ncbi:MAG: M48 family metallopeptidase [Saprospiraceae bacterium]|nr:M48 family metallopeptidase [Saprospiraceae bacterium]
MIKKVGVLLLVIFALQACKKVPVTGRSQINLIGDDSINKMAEQQYNMVLDQSRTVNNTSNGEMVERVGERISNAVDRYAKANGFYEDIADYNWEFNLIDENVANAWCMPGGKVAFYTGILPFTESEEGMAVVMGHEVAHAIARHGAERLSQQLLAQGLSVGAAIASAGTNVQTQNTINQAFGIGSTLGILAFSRKHESEADKMGLIFMAMAGYDPREAVEFWKRMSESGGQAPPEFLSTHPSHETRIKDLEENLPEALKYYKPRTGISN